MGKNSRKILATRLKEAVELTRNYGPAFALYGFVWWVCFYIKTPVSGALSAWALRKKTAWLDRYISKKYKDTLEDLDVASHSPLEVDSHRIWVFWGQGRDKMPPLVDICFSRLCANHDNVTLITASNIKQYLDLPEDLFVKLEKGALSWAHFSDIVRTSLLARYGGLWLDATVFVPEKIDFARLGGYEIFSPSSKTYPGRRDSRFWTSADLNWSGWALWSRRKHERLFEYVSTMLIEMALKERVLADYVMIDYHIYSALRRYDSVYAQMANFNESPCIHKNTLASLLNKPFDSKLWESLMSTDNFFKLSFRSKFESQAPDGTPTFFGVLFKSEDKSISVRP